MNLFFFFKQLFKLYRKICGFRIFFSALKILHNFFRKRKNSNYLAVFLTDYLRLLSYFLNWFCCCPSLLESFNATGGVDNFFVACIEWVARTTNFNVYLRQTRRNDVSRSTGASGLDFIVIFRMDIFLHKPVLY